MNELTCKICNQIKISKAALFIHIAQKHKTTKYDYYNKYLKEKNDGICVICGKDAKWVSSKGKYNKYCSIVCCNSDKIKHKKHSLDLLTRSMGIRPTIEQIKDMQLNRKGHTEKNICIICNKKYKSLRGVSFHCTTKHLIGSKEYYDLFYKQEKDGTCLTCGKETKWSKDTVEYLKYCNSICFGADNEQIKRREHTCLEKYGTANINALPEKIDKTKRTCFDKYGNVCAVQAKDIHKKAEQTWMYKYGVDHFAKAKEVRDKIKNTLQHNYNVNSPFDSPIIRQRSKNTMIERYGVSYAMQNPDSHKLNQKNNYKAKQYNLPSGTIVNLRGFEPNFLDFVFQNNLLHEKDIDYSPKTVKYINRIGTSAYYYPDFHIPKLNLIVEIKSNYTVKLDKNLEQKKEACLQKGFNYICIVDNNFEEFKQLVDKS